MDEKYYIDNLKKYTNTINLALKISKLSAGRQVERKIGWACILFTKICVTGRSILILSPDSEIAKKKIPHWDFSSLFSLTRNLVECYQTMFYLCVDNVSLDELKARKKLFNLHDYYSRKKFSSLSSDEQENEKIKELVIKELCETDFFKSLTGKQQKDFLKGEKTFFISREDIEKRMGNDPNTFRSFYKLFSSNTHSFPMGFYGMLQGGRGTGVKSETEIKYSGFALDVAEHYVRRASVNMINFFPDIIAKLTDTEKNILGIIYNK